MAILVLSGEASMRAGRNGRSMSLRADVGTGDTLHRESCVPARLTTMIEPAASPRCDAATGAAVTAACGEAAPPATGAAGAAATGAAAATPAAIASATTAIAAATALVAVHRRFAVLPVLL